jgi:hypothetical protein
MTLHGLKMMGIKFLKYTAFLPPKFEDFRQLI